MSKKVLRQTLKARRLQLSADFQKTASAAIVKTLLSLPEFLEAKAVAGYLPHQGEVDLGAFFQNVWAQNKITCLPVLHPDKTDSLLFACYDFASVLVRNRYGIEEPDLRLSERISAQNLSVVLVPLLGFDDQGNRLGMGKGFYDRTFAFLKSDQSSTRSSDVRRPILIGLAYECQFVEHLPSDDWDVGLDKIVTEKRCINCFEESR